MKHLYISHEWTVAEPRPQERLLRAIRIILQHPEDVMPVSLYVRVATPHQSHRRAPLPAKCANSYISLPKRHRAAP
jgi:hypothetical protein